MGNKGIVMRLQFWITAFYQNGVINTEEKMKLSALAKQACTNDAAMDLLHEEIKKMMDIEKVSSRRMVEDCLEVFQ